MKGSMRRSNVTGTKSAICEQRREYRQRFEHHEMEMSDKTKFTRCNSAFTTAIVYSANSTRLSRKRVRQLYVAENRVANW